MRRMLSFRCALIRAPLRAAVLGAALLTLVACAAPSRQPADTAPRADAAPTSTVPATAASGAQSNTPTGSLPRTRPAPEMSRPLPPQRVEDAAVKLDYRCRTASDCAIKNVGSCCGEMPQCVNKDSPTDPAAVQAACASSGRMGICGFQPIDRCECVRGRCEGQVMEVNGLQVPNPDGQAR